MFNVGDRVKLKSTATDYINELGNGLDVGSLGTVITKVKDCYHCYRVRFDVGYFGKLDAAPVFIDGFEIELVTPDDINTLLKLAQAAIIHYSRDPDEQIANDIGKFLDKNN